jgi:hypothetical protein
MLHRSPDVKSIGSLGKTLWTAEPLGCGRRVPLYHCGRVVLRKVGTSANHRWLPFVVLMSLATDEFCVPARSNSSTAMNRS